MRFLHNENVKEKTNMKSNIEILVGDIVRNSDGRIYEIVSHDKENNTYTLKYGHSSLYKDIDTNTVSKMEVFKRAI